MSRTKRGTERLSRMTWLWSLALAYCLTGCMYAPYDGQQVDQNENVYFMGWGIDPDSWIQISVEVPDSNGGIRYRTIAWARTAHEPSTLFQAGANRNFYAYSGNFTVPFEAWRIQQSHDGRTVLGAKIRAYDQRRGTSYYGVRSDRDDCYSRFQNNSSDYANHCGVAGDTIIEMR